MKKSFRGAGSAVLAVTVVALLAVLALAGCDEGQSDTLEDLAEMEPGDGPVGEERIAELKRQIENYREIVEEKVQATGQLAVYYKMLGRAYMTRRMYGPALDALEEAIRIEAANPIVFYRAAVAAGQLGSSAGSEPEARRHFETAERYYERAIELDPEYVDALYGLAVLYTFELDRPEEALDLLERATTVEPGRARPFMLMGRVLLELGRPEAAAEAYGKAAETAESEQIRDAALENRRRILGE
ncbi:MAG: tetratricopeptide repeat protein [Spirochaetia bacterium]